MHCTKKRFTGTTSIVQKKIQKCQDARIVREALREDKLRLELRQKQIVGEHIIVNWKNIQGQDSRNNDIRGIGIRKRTRIDVAWCMIRSTFGTQKTVNINPYVTELILKIDSQQGQDKFNVLVLAGAAAPLLKRSLTEEYMAAYRAQDSKYTQM